MIELDVTKLSFAFCCSFYNDVKGLRRLLASAAGNFEYCFMLDGRYGYLANSDDDYFSEPLSIDGSREVVNSYKDKNVVLLDYPDLSESKKRMKYIEVAEEYGVDCILTLDSDEYVWFANWEKLRLECYQKMIVRDKGVWNIYNIPFRDESRFSGRPRLWFHPHELAYGLTHYEFYKKSDPERTLITMGGDTYHYLDNILINHDRTLRSLDHLLARERWECAQQQVEDKVMWGKDWEGLKTVRHALPPR